MMMSDMIFHKRREGSKRFNFEVWETCGREKCALNFEVKHVMLCSVCFGSFMQLFCFNYYFLFKKERHV